MGEMSVNCLNQFEFKSLEFLHACNNQVGGLRFISYCIATFSLPVIALIDAVRYGYHTCKSLVGRVSSKPQGLNDVKSTHVKIDAIAKNLIFNTSKTLDAKANYILTVEFDAAISKLVEKIVKKSSTIDKNLLRNSLIQDLDELIQIMDLYLNKLEFCLIDINKVVSSMNEVIYRKFRALDKVDVSNNLFKLFEVHFSKKKSLYNFRSTILEKIRNHREDALIAGLLKMHEASLVNSEEIKNILVELSSTIYLEKLSVYGAVSAHCSIKQLIDKSVKSNLLNTSYANEVFDSVVFDEKELARFFCATYMQIYLEKHPDILEKNIKQKVEFQVDKIFLDEVIDNKELFFDLIFKESIKLHQQIKKNLKRKKKLLEEKKIQAEKQKELQLKIKFEKIRRQDSYIQLFKAIKAIEKKQIKIRRLVNCFHNISNENIKQKNTLFSSIKKIFNQTQKDLLEFKSYKLQHVDVLNTIQKEALFNLEEALNHRTFEFKSFINLKDQ